MLTVIDKPRQIIRGEDMAIHKIAYLFGSLGVISSAARNRLRDRLCRQIPKEDFSGSYHVRVRYAVASDGEVRIQVVWAAFKPDHWTCLYDAGLGKIGILTAETGTSRSYFLEGDEEVRDIIFAYEQKLALRRLIKRGPKAFPKIRAH
ncbi:MAG: hypothetical protein Q7S10_03675 [bacterium]|nr:hypothetical protein [bacterium]